MNIKGQRVAKGIKGIREFYAKRVFEMGWQVFTDEDENGYKGYDEISARAIINRMNANGYTFSGFTGNGLSFTKD